MFNFAGWILSVQHAILNLETTYSSVLLGVSQSAALGMLMVLLISVALRSSKSGEPPAAPFLMVVMRTGLVLAVLSAWTVTPAGLAYPIGTWIPNEGLFLARLISWDGAQNVSMSLSSWGGMEVPGGAFISVGTIYWLFAQVFLLLASLALGIVIVGPQVIVTALIVIGPIFVVMWPLPELTAYARGYVRCLITYSLVPPLAAVVLLGIGYILKLLNTGFGVATSVENYLPHVFGLCLSMCLGLWAMVRVVKFSSEIMTGSASGGIGWIAGAATAVKAFL